MYNATTAILYLLENRGQEVTLDIPQGTPVYDPATGTYTYGAPDPIIVLGYPSEYKLSEIDNNTIVKGDQKLALASIDTSGNPVAEPKVSSTVTVAGKDFTVVDVQTIYEGTAVACYICQVRNG